jgi:hypothetical protein
MCSDAAEKTVKLRGQRRRGTIVPSFGLRLLLPTARRK